MKEPVVTINLKEYNELKDLKLNLKKDIIYVIYSNRNNNFEAVKKYYTKDAVISELAETTQAAIKQLESEQQNSFKLSEEIKSIKKMNIFEFYKYKRK